LIVIFVLVIFLGNLRAGLIVASAIPLFIVCFGNDECLWGKCQPDESWSYRFWVDCRWSCDYCRSHFAPFGSKEINAAMTQSEMDEEVFLSASKIRSSAAFGEIIILIVYIPILTLAGVEGKCLHQWLKQ
jgi:cobalt-zinc-cadmium resistance protein CzcA